MKSRYLSIIAFLLIGLFAVPVFAQNTVFNTLAEAQQNCPAINDLTFTSLNLKNPDSIGIITSTFNGVKFFTVNSMMRPQRLALNDIIQKVTFRYVSALPGYGYISGNNTVCLYSYPNFTGGPVALIMQTII